MSQIMPFLWFDTEAEEAVKFYVSVFNNSKIDDISRYGDAGPLPAGTAMVIEFTLDGQDFMALNGGKEAAREGQPPVSLFASCETQAEVDRLWEKLTAGGTEIQCGWLTDKYGITWNIVPKGIGELIAGDDPQRSQRAMRAMMQMVKLDIDELRRAYEGVPS
jgi:predicted 3-demethylubiquinone-9 3-methyltransferase (glyoxalase superfamily)